MLSVAKLAPGQEAYYEASVARGIDEYYAGRGESPGIWTGGGAEALGLVGVVAEGDLGRLMRGVNPTSGDRLRAPVHVRRFLVAVVDPATGEPRQVERELRPVAGFDLVFGAPKSVSLMHALGDEQMRFTVAQAHEAAWRAAIDYLVDAACVTRQGRNGVVRERGSGFVAAGFAHRTSRAGDPHLHTHVIVANAAQSPDGRWRALDGDLLLRGYRVAAGSLYQAQLRYELTMRLGVDWEPVVQGMAELRGVPEGVVRAFSTRRRQIEAHLEEHGTSGWRAAQTAAIMTRDAKQALDLETLRTDWRERATERGLDAAALDRVLDRKRWRTPAAIDRETVQARLLGVEGLTATAASFSEAEIVAALAASLPHGAPATAIRCEAAEFEARREVVALDKDDGAVGVPRRFTTATLARTEQFALALGAAAGRPVPQVPASSAVLELARVGVQLSGEQRQMVLGVASSAEWVVCVVGQAGAGKTTAIRALRGVLEQAGLAVIGAAPSGVAADTLERETGIRSMTLHRLAASANRNGLPARCVLVVDEAGMADTRTLTRLLHHASRVDGKVVLVGDPAQLGAVGPGGLFAVLVEQHGALTLAENHRQRDPAEAAVLSHLRRGDPEPYLAWAAKQGRVIVADSFEGARDQLVADWYTAICDGASVRGCLMIAHRRSDAGALNAAARTLLRADGRIGPDLAPLADGVALAVGDRVLCLRNDRTLEVVNGTRGTVATIRDDGTVVVRTDAGAERALPAAYRSAGHLAHGYAVTGHKAQGQTVEQAFVLASNHADAKEWTYVATTRARDSTRIYLDDGAPVHDASPRIRDERDPLTRLADNAARAGNEHLATLSARRSRDGSANRGDLRGELGVVRSEQQRIERELGRLGPIRRHTQGPRLRAEQAALAAAARRIEQRIEHLDERILRSQAELRARIAEAAAARATTPTRAPRLAAERNQGPDLGR